MSDLILDEIKNPEAGQLLISAHEGLVYLCHPKMASDENGVGYIGFTPDEARNLAAILLCNADKAEE